MIVSGGDDGTLRVWELATGTPCGKPLYGHDGRVSSLALGTLEGWPVIVSGGEDRTLRVRDSSGVVVSSVRTGSKITDLAFVPPGTFAVATSQGLFLLIFESRPTLRPAAQWV